MVKKKTRSKQLGVRIPTPAVWEGFRMFVNESRGRLHSKLGEEVEEALKCYMAHYDYDWMEAIGYDITTRGIRSEDYGEHTHKLSTEDRKIYKNLLDNYGKGSTIGFGVIGTVMIKTCGWTSDRTHKTHVDVLVAHNCLEEIYEYEEYEIIGNGNIVEG